MKTREEKILPVTTSNGKAKLRKATKKASSKQTISKETTSPAKFVPSDSRKRGGLHNKSLGKRGEEAATSFLERKGFAILDRNWVCPVGEVDIVAEDQEAVVFIEVKTRSNCEKGLPEESITSQKRQKYEKIAGFYLKDHDVVDKAVRFDVISILVVGSERAFLRHHRDAFAFDA